MSPKWNGVNVKEAIGRQVLSYSPQVDTFSPTAALGGKVRREEERESRQGDRIRLGT